MFGLQCGMCCIPPLVPWSHAPYSCPTPGLMMILLTIRNSSCDTHIYTHRSLTCTSSCHTSTLSVTWGLALTAVPTCCTSSWSTCQVAPSLACCSALAHWQRERHAATRATCCSGWSTSTRDSASLCCAPAAAAAAAAAADDDDDDYATAPSACAVHNLMPLRC